MSSTPFQLALLDRTHNRAAFNSDSEPLNRYLQTQASQDVSRRVAACYVAFVDDQRIAGYYSLASSSVLLTELPADIAKSCLATRLFQRFVWGVWPSIKLSKDKG